MSLALVGAAVGTVAGGDTPFQRVIITNPSSSPIPVTGTINVGNAPANQSVTVTNFPQTQAVSGTVNVGAASLGTSDVFSWDEGETQTFPIGFNVSSLDIHSGFDDSELWMYLDTQTAADVILIDQGVSYSRDFTLPLPVRSVKITCMHAGSGLGKCRAGVYAFGVR